MILAFKDYKVYTKAPSFWNNMANSEWVGFRNFRFLFSSTDTGKIIRNTIGYNVLWIILGLVLSVGLAIMLNEITRKKVAKTYQTLMFFPYFLSWVVASYFVLAFLDPTRGLITSWQMNNGMDVINWYHEPKYWPVILTICNVWKNTGYSSILYLAAITGIDDTQYEAAAIDGCNKFQILFKILVPIVRPSIITSSIFAFYWIWQDFFQPLIFMNSTRKFTIPLALNMYLDPNSYNNYGGLFAMSVISVLPIIIFFIIFQRYLVDGIAMDGIKG